jgi:hypothetical protein
LEKSCEEDSSQLFFDAWGCDVRDKCKKAIPPSQSSPLPFVSGDCDSPPSEAAISGLEEGSSKPNLLTSVCLRKNEKHLLKISCSSFLIHSGNAKHWLRGTFFHAAVQRRKEENRLRWTDRMFLTLKATP